MKSDVQTWTKGIGGVSDNDFAYIGAQEGMCS